jgi:hypothetical protein
MNFWADDFDVDVPEFRLPAVPSDMSAIMPSTEAEAILSAALLAHKGRHAQAEDSRARAGYEGLGGEPMLDRYWPHDNNPED